MISKNFSDKKIKIVFTEIYFKYLFILLPLLVNSIFIHLILKWHA